MTRSRRLVVVALAGMLATVLVAAPASARPGNNAGGGNISCASLGFDGELKLDGEPSRVGQVVRNGDVAVEITALKSKKGGDLVAFKWVQLRGPAIERVIVKGGPTAHVYGTWLSENDGWYWSPVKSGDTKHYGVSNVKWCYGGAQS
ncbi:MAG: hypothetical protein DWP92_05795 [Armatimonadetes bacterium]|nr:MAG: hypothetical protein DWP92_05795 [Armatimonadota bacterium]